MTLYWFSEVKKVPTTNSFTRLSTSNSCCFFASLGANNLLRVCYHSQDKAQRLRNVMRISFCPQRAHSMLADFVCVCVHIRSSVKEKTYYISEDGRFTRCY